MCDIDFFKPYNDANGHLKGDETLRVVARAIQVALPRPTDTASRYGGEEFAVLLPDTTLEGALGVAERLRRAVSERHIRHDCSVAGPEISPSLGVAALVPTLDGSAETLIGMADDALYAAKKKGRNTVVAAPAGDEEFPRQQ